MESVLEKIQSRVLHDISWDSYVQIADELQEESAAHVNFDRGELEIMVLSLEHENLKKLLAFLFERLADNLEIEIFAAGSTTFRRRDLDRGFEPDECYYVKNAGLMRGKNEVNLDFDPSPDLSIEVDVKSSSLDRMGLFAAVGIPEVWRHSEDEVKIFILRNGAYEISAVSSSLAGVLGKDLTRLVDIGLRVGRKEFLKNIDEYTNHLSALLQ